MSDIHNLSTKNIKEFTKEDTIYIKDKNSFNKQQYLCQFVSYDAGAQRVTGTVLRNNQEYERGVGRELTAPLKDCSLFGESEMNGNKHPRRHSFDSLGYALNPLDAEKDVADVHVPEHESYAVISGGRRNSTGVALFGTSIAHNQTISITISTAKHNRSLNNDNIWAEKELIQIELSENQFAQFITSMNSGGIPCTIRRLGGKGMANPPYQTKQEIFEAEFKKEMNNFTLDVQKALESTTEILKKQSIGKEDKKQILENTSRLISHVNSTIPFIREQFREQMDDVIHDAKTQIEAFAENVIRTKGLEALAAQNPELKEIILKLQGKDKDGNKE